jgi:hypothetical protein
VLDRAMHEGRGRTVTLSGHLQTHAGGRTTFLRLVSDYHASSRLHVLVWENGIDGLCRRSVDWLRRRQYPDSDALASRLRAELERRRAEGDITEAVYWGCAGGPDVLDESRRAAERSFERAIESRRASREPSLMSDAVRRFLLFVLLLGMAGTATELLLLEHDEDLNQSIPLAVLGAGFVSLAWSALRPGAAAVSAVKLVAVSFILSGVAGVGLHYRANLEFQLEVDPSLSGWALWQKGIRAKSPPGLAPGVMVQLGLLGLLYTLKHPAGKGTGHFR